MKRFLMLLAAIAVALAAYAQQGKYYVDGREVTAEEFRTLPMNRVAKMDVAEEGGTKVFRVRLKPEEQPAARERKEARKEGDASEPAAKRQPGELDLTGDTDLPFEERLARAIRKVYDETTLLKEGDRAADFTAACYAGGEVSLADHRGKVVLLTFWATWCGPCLKELAPEALPAEVLDRFRDRADFLFLPVAYTDTPQSLDKFFASEKGTAYAYLKELAAMDPDKTIHGLYATQSIPRSFVIGRDGTIVYGSLGAAAGEAERIAEAIAAALEAE